jgi:LmbE family N-acetylglucosaminyl deacetylase
MAGLSIALTACAAQVTGARPRFLYNPAAPAASPERPVLRLDDDDRILILAPHPDDEVLATGGVIQQALARKLPIQVLFLTNGDNNEFAYLFFRKAFTLDPKSATDAGDTRALEALRAGRELGLTIGEESFLGYPDFGTLEIWLSRWGEREAYRSMFTDQNAVPYWFTLTPDAPYKGEAILSDLKHVLSDFQPTKVFVSHPADTNPDHAAYYLFLRTALWDLKDETPPEVFLYLTHYGEWPQPRGLLIDAPHEPPAKFDEIGRWLIFPVEPGQVEKKLAAIRRHATQYEASGPYLESYMRRNELFDRVEDIPLSSNSPEAVILPSGTGLSGDAAPQGAWDDGAVRRVRLEGNELVLTFELGQPAPNGISAQPHVIGYRHDRPFAEMPKLLLDMKGAGCKVYERRQRVPDASVKVVSTLTMSEARIPLALLGDPERIFLAAHTQAGSVALDAIPWVVLDLMGGH